MRIINLPKNVISIQKCLLPDSEYLRSNYGRYCRIDVPGSDFGILVKIGLCDPKQLTGGFFVDKSVFVFRDSNRTKHTIEVKGVEFENFQILSPVSTASVINVTIVFDNITGLVRQKLRTDRLKRIIKEILKLYIFSVNSVVLFDNLSPEQKNGIYCLDIHAVNGESVNKDDIYKCTQETDIIINECVSKNKYEACFRPEREIKLGGLTHVYETVKEVIEFSKQALHGNGYFKISNKILITGPPGCGKTTVIQKVVRDCKTVLLQVLLPDICSSLPGESEKNLQNVFDTAKIHAQNNENCVILIENVDAFCINRKDGGGSNLKRTLNQLVSLLDEFDDVNQVVVIATTTDVDDVDPVLKQARRFDNELEIMPPTQSEREEIIANIFSYFNVTCLAETVKTFALWTPGFVGADLYLAIQETIIKYNKNKGDFGEHTLEYWFKKIISTITPTSLKGSIGLKVVKDVDFSKIGGLDDIKRLLHYSVKQQLLHPEIFNKMGIPLTKGILLYGPPGCAKTTLAKALAKECNMTFLSVSSADLYSPYVGDPEKRILKLFTQARIGAPAIIFIDEIDGLVGSKSGDRTQGVQERVLSTLLVEMDGISLAGVFKNESLKLSGDCAGEKLGDEPKPPETRTTAIIVVGATNRPERLDPALKRPGRFDKMVYVPPPDEAERLNILNKLTEKIPLGDTVDLEYIASVTGFYSGADLKNLCYESALLALTDSGMTATCVDQSHFTQILSRTRPSLNSEMIAFYESFKNNDLQI